MRERRKMNTKDKEGVSLRKGGDKGKETDADNSSWQLRRRRGEGGIGEI